MNSIPQIVKKFEGQIINYPTYNLAYMTIQRSIQSTQMRGVGSCVVLVGKSGVGKSTLCKQLMGTLPPTSTEVGPGGYYTKRPALYCALPTKATLKTFGKALLKSLDCSSASGDAYDLAERAITQIAVQKVEVAYLDEIQMLADKQAEQARTDVSNGIARLVDATGIPFVVAGTLNVEELVYSVDLLIRRFPFYAVLPQLALDLGNPGSDLLIVLRALDQKMYELGHLERGVHLHEPDMALPLYAATTGNMEALRLLLSNALFSALNRGNQSLCTSDFADSFDITRHDHCLLDEGNPFELPFKSLLKKVEDKNVEKKKNK